MSSGPAPAKHLVASGDGTRVTVNRPLGGLLGAVAALLMSPSSGEELRARIQSEAQRVQDEVNKAAMERRAELEKQLNQMRAPRPPGPGGM